MGRNSEGVTAAETEARMASEAKALKVAMVTGAGSGIGKAVALELAREGYAMVLAGRRAEPLESVAREIKQAGAGPMAGALVVTADVSDVESVQALFAKTKEAFGRLDVLFNNAGISGGSVAIEEQS